MRGTVRSVGLVVPAADLGDVAVAIPAVSEELIAVGEVRRWPADRESPGTWTDRLLVVIVLLGVWQIASAGSGRYWLGSPLDTVGRLVTGIASGTFVVATGYTAVEALAGLLLGGGIAAVLPFVLRRHVFLLSALDPFMSAGHGAPKLALAPLFIVWFGIGPASKVALVAVSVFFITYAHTREGIRSIGKGVLDMALVAGATHRQISIHVILPGAIPHVFTGVRAAVPYSIGAAVVGELLSANRGLGYLVQFSVSGFDTPGVLAALAMVAILVAATNSCAAVIERRLTSWRQSSSLLR